MAHGGPLVRAAQEEANRDSAQQADELRQESE